MSAQPATTFESEVGEAPAEKRAAGRRNPEFIIKLSKHCNLRCTYCYEYNDLADKRRISIRNIERLLSNIRGYCENNGLKARFIWHGGEPLLIRPEAYLEIGDRQREILGEATPYWNGTQTNLTVLTDEILEFLAARAFFDGLGVSVDPFGSERVDIRGRCRNELVFANMQRLRDRQVSFGAITVLTRATLPMLKRNFVVFDTLGVGFRALPFYLSAFDAQTDAHALTYDEIVGAYVQLLDLWLASERAVPIDPLRDYIRFAIRYVLGREKTYRDPWRDETIFIVNIDGGVWGEAGEYGDATRYGNVVDQDLEEILASEPRQRECARAEALVETHCGRCPYYGHCPGDYVIHATEQQRALLETSGCVVRETIDQILVRFAESGLGDRIRAGAEPPVAEVDEAEAENDPLNFGPA